MPSSERAEAPERIVSAHGRTLLSLAFEAIARALERSQPFTPDVARLPPALGLPGASFVTLKKQGSLRGCIGSPRPHRPLALDVAANARAAALEDPRFPPLAAPELDALELAVSVLSPHEPLGFRSEEELLAQLRPGIDGLVIEAGPRRALFLPAVWETLPDPALFLAHLKAKAGLPRDYFGPELRAARFTATSVSAPVPELRAAGTEEARA